MRLVAHKRPEFINFHLDEPRRQARVAGTPPLPAQQLQDSRRTQGKHARDVADATAVQSEWHNEAAHQWVAALIAIVNDELTTATPAAEALFAIGSYAILNNVPRGTPRTSDFFSLHN